MKQVEVLWKHPDWGFKQYTCDFVGKSADPNYLCLVTYKPERTTTINLREVYQVSVEDTE